MLWGRRQSLILPLASRPTRLCTDSQSLSLPRTPIPGPALATKSRRDLYENLGESGAGIHFVLTIAVFTLAGLGLDRLFGTDPALTIVFGVIGFVGGFLRVVYWEQYEDARRRTLGRPERRQREVPEVLREKAGAAGTRLRGDVSGVATMADYRPRRFGDPVPESLVVASGVPEDDA